MVLNWIVILEFGNVSVFRIAHGAHVFADSLRVNNLVWNAFATGTDILKRSDAIASEDGTPRMLCTEKQAPIIYTQDAFQFICNFNCFFAQSARYKLINC
jgi:hypothetical protein